ncbi:hypothetical protein BJ138DRAFT_50612 [Hygrophoropsis aurantiaca]|uniref:Uncharacterized protein n=1 Tax=Hygrophoropsis aurantiaca TaxID=72124 RepID=A0ACB7ZUD9_9AGAM|nr:hypothetical protein BJ138DRAFT_50612 [Hygrophoropsis aurantiaca]
MSSQVGNGRRDKIPHTPRRSPSSSCSSSRASPLQVSAEAGNESDCSMKATTNDETGERMPDDPPPVFPRPLDSCLDLVRQTSGSGPGASSLLRTPAPPTQPMDVDDPPAFPRPLSSFSDFDHQINDSRPGSSTPSRPTTPAIQQMDVDDPRPAFPRPLGLCAIQVGSSRPIPSRTSNAPMQSPDLDSPIDPDRTIKPIPCRDGKSPETMSPEVLPLGHFDPQRESSPVAPRPFNPISSSVSGVSVSCFAYTASFTTQSHFPLTPVRRLNPNNSIRPRSTPSRNYWRLCQKYGEVSPPRCSPPKQTCKREPRERSRRRLTCRQRRRCGP